MIEAWWYLACGFQTVMQSNQRFRHFLQLAQLGLGIRVAQRGIANDGEALFEQGGKFAQPRIVGRIGLGHASIIGRNAVLAKTASA